MTGPRAVPGAPTPSGAPAVIARLLCPRCRRGKVFRGLVTMHERCAECGHSFEREPGYFVGAMYVSYALAVPIYAGLALAVHLLRPAWSETRFLAAALALFLPLAPLLFRYSRVLWMHLDWAIDPDRSP